MTAAVSRVLAAAGWTTHQYLIAGWGTEHTAQHPATRSTVVVTLPDGHGVEMHLCRIAPEQAQIIAHVMTGRVDEALSLAYALVAALDAQHPSAQVREQAIGLLSGRLSGVLAELGTGTVEASGGAR